MLEAGCKELDPEVSKLLQKGCAFLSRQYRGPPSRQQQDVHSSTTQLVAAVLKLQQQQHTVADQTLLTVALVAPSLMINWLDMQSILQCFGPHTASTASDVMLILKAAKQPDLDTRWASDVS